MIPRDLPARIAFCVIVLLLVGVGTYWDGIMRAWP